MMNLQLLSTACGMSRNRTLIIQQVLLYDDIYVMCTNVNMNKVLGWKIKIHSFHSTSRRPVSSYALQSEIQG